MIHITQIIEYLRTKFPTWNIDGAVEVATAEDKSRLPAPSMFVGLAKFDAETISHSTYQQNYLERFVILTCTPTTRNDDRTGKYAQDFVLTARRMLMSVLVNYKEFDPDSHAIEIVSDEPEKLDKARYWHKFVFKIAGSIEPADVTPLELDLFDKFFAEIVPSDATDDTPTEEMQLNDLYFPPPED